MIHLSKLRLLLMVEWSKLPDLLKQNAWETQDDLVQRVGDLSEVERQFRAVPVR